MNFPDNIPWCEKHRALCFADIKGQDLAVDKINIFLKSFPRKRAAILHGPPGVGKTSLAYVIAAEIDAEILELNASDLRNKEKILQIIKPASEQRSLFKRSKIILVDEVDGISVKDRGGLSELLGIVEKTSFPVIITANDIWKPSFNLLRQRCELIQLKDVDYKVILDILKIICTKENCVVSNDVLTSISIKSRGDIRAAINDLQALSKLDEHSFVKEIGERNKEESIFNSLQYVFKNASLDTKMLGIFDNVDMNIDEIFLWVEENIPLEYRKEELAKAFDALSRADMFRGRIYTHQHWRFMVYEYFLLGPGIAASKKFNRAGWTSYKKPSRILKIWLNNQRVAKKKTICQKYAKHVHISTKRAMKDFLVLRIILKNNIIRKELKLNEEEIEYLDKQI